jgi:predicted transcriptional regulator of viral defense system
VAARQNAVITTQQLLESGISAPAITQRVQAGRLFRKHQGVYAVGRPDLSPAGRFHAAVLAIGEDAVLSHRAAAALWGFWDRDIDRVEVTVPRRVPSRKQIRVYQVSDIPRAARTRWRGVPITTPARIVLDLAATLPSARRSR